MVIFHFQNPGTMETGLFLITLFADYTLFLNIFHYFNSDFLPLAFSILHHAAQPSVNLKPESGVLTPKQSNPAHFVSSEDEMRRTNTQREGFTHAFLTVF